MTSQPQTTPEDHPSRSILAFALASLLMLAGLRLFLAIDERAALSDLDPLQRLHMLWIGARLDASALARLLYLPLLGLLLPRSVRGFVSNGAIWFLTVALSLEIVFEVVFFEYYGVRPNYLVFEHGADQEVVRASMAYVTPFTITAFVALLAASRFLQRLVGRLLRGIPVKTLGSPYAGVALFLLSIGCIELLARGTLDHRPINPSVAFFSSNRIANEVASSGIFNLGYEGVHALKSTSVRLSEHHALLSDAEVGRRVRRVLGESGRFTNDSPNPYVRIVEGVERERPLNVVIVVMESFTGRLVGALGGTPALSPELDALSREGVLLTNCYATGERTVQGLEAVLSSFPPLPGVSVVRRPRARGHFETLASVLGRRGYDTLFLYGGQGLFDHMGGFFRSNGYDTFLEEDDFDSPSFRGTWGVSDEDVFRRANAEFQARWERGTPFLGTVLTVSLHSPWEFPKGRSPSLPEDTEVPRGFVREELENFLYADFAVGEFMREAKTLDYSRDTLFVFVGDHGVHIRGRELLPSEEFRVPTLFLGPGWLEPTQIEATTSQIDIAPTVMGLVGGTYRSAFFGRDVLETREDSAAILVYHKRDYGVRNKDRLTIVASGREPEGHLASARWSTTPTAVTEDHIDDARDALAVVQVAETLLNDQSYTSEAAPVNRPNRATNAGKP